jgi:hypothetical protein
MGRTDVGAGADNAWAPADGLTTGERIEPPPPAGPDVAPGDRMAGGAGGEGGPSGDAADPPTPPSPASTPQPAGLPGRPAGRRKGRYTLEIRFESRPGSNDLARLVESTVWVNDAHPAWIRAAASRADGYHIALSVAMALAPLAVEPAHAHAFITRFMARWGEATPGKAKGRKASKRRP